ncbi:MAG: alpha-hydroxy-acid oxidizing protein, partial [Spongiibacteraceae bacterium]
EIRAAVGERLTVLIDSGFRRGTDVIKALALGAHGVLLGRATLYGLAAAGEAGAAHALGMFHAEMARTLALLGCPRLADLKVDQLRLISSGQ